MQAKHPIRTFVGLGATLMTIYARADVVYVDINATNPGAGTTWCTAKTDLRIALQPRKWGWKWGWNGDESNYCG